MQKVTAVEPVLDERLLGKPNTLGMRGWSPKEGYCVPRLLRQCLVVQGMSRPRQVPLFPKKT